MGSKDAFASLMSSVPGVDTSGFVKRSLNEIRSSNKEPRKAAAAAGPKDVPVQAPTSQPEKVPIVGGVQSSMKSSTRLSSGREGNLGTSHGNARGFEGVSVGSGGPSSGQEVNYGVSDDRVQFSDSDLDALGSQGGGIVAPPVPNVGADFVDPFEDMAEFGEPVDNSVPASLVQTNTSGSGNVFNEDLLGLGGGQFSAGIEIGAETYEFDSRGVSKVFGNISGLEGPGHVGQTSSNYHDGLIPGFADLGLGQEACSGPNDAENPVPHGNFVNQNSLPVADDVRAAKPVLTTNSDVDNDWGPDDELSAVVIGGSHAHGRRTKKLKLGQISPQMSAAGKTLLAKISRKSKHDESTKSSKGEGNQGDRKNRFSKYGATFQKKAMEYSKKGIGAMKHGIVAATDWMDKYLEERKEVTGEGRRQDSDMDAIEIAVDLEKLSPRDRGLVLEQLDPKLRQKVINLFNSQRVSVGEDDPQPGTPNPFHDDQTHNCFEPPSQLPSQSQSQSPDFGGSDPAQSESPRMSRPMSIPNLTKAHHPQDDLDPIGTSAPELRACHLDDAEENDGNEYDLLGMNANTQDQTPRAPITEVIKEPSMADPDDLDVFFGGGGSTTPEPPSHANPPASLDDIFAAPGPSFIHDDLINVREFPTGAGVGEYKYLYREADVGTSNEPEIRKRLREQRIREKHIKMQDALQEKLLKEQEEIEFQEAQQTLKLELGPRIKEWSDGSRGNIRGLLTSLHTVLWEDSNWAQLTVGDVLETNQVKKAYRKANLIVHPDKVRQKNGTEEQTAIADMVFDVLKEAWGLFEQ